MVVFFVAFVYGGSLVIDQKIPIVVPDDPVKIVAPEEADSDKNRQKQKKYKTTSASTSQQQYHRRMMER